MADSAFQYDPFNLPRAINFHLAAQELPLTDAQKTQFQIKFSKMSQAQAKETLEYLDDMRYTAMKDGRYKMAAFCKAVKEFAEVYLYSLKKQKKI